MPVAKPLVPSSTGEEAAGTSALTPAQRAAVESEGNVLVCASAGTGKTHILIERVLARLRASPQASLDRMLLVTFTEAAATELKERLLERLAHIRAGLVPGTPARWRWEEQEALLPLAEIGTLHSVCLRRVREHAHALHIDPQFTILSAAQQRLLRDECLDHVLEAASDPHGPQAPRLVELLNVQAGGREAMLRELIEWIHDYTQSLPEPGAWLLKEHQRFAHEEPIDWLALVPGALNDWINVWRHRLRREPTANERAHHFAEDLERGFSEVRLEEFVAFLRRVRTADLDWPRGTKKLWREPVAGFYDEAAYWLALVGDQGTWEGLRQDWTWVRASTGLLLELVSAFSELYASRKRQSATLDFSDLEQFTLRLFWDAIPTHPSALAQQWRARFDWISVDEYQDINAAQDMLLRALGRELPLANRFLVGDVKQSIYRFRLAKPGLFAAYQRAWAGDQPHQHVIPLADNFRSHESLLRFSNALAGTLFRSGVGQTPYDDSADLRLGSPNTRAWRVAKAGEPPRASLHVILEPQDPDHSPSPDATAPDEEGSEGVLTSLQREARHVACAVRAMVDAAWPIWDDDLGRERPVKCSDVAVLMRSLSGRAEVFAQQFCEAGVPLHIPAARGFDDVEVRDVLSLLRVLDNPLQDIPLLALLRSPMVGLSLDDLAIIRAGSRRTPFWTALRRAHRHGLPNRGDHQVTGAGDCSAESTATPSESTGPAPGARAEAGRLSPEAWRQVDVFLDQMIRWRRAGREASLSQRLEAMLRETGYLDWLLAQSRGGERVNQVRALIQLARQFDPLRRQGLTRFLRFIEAQQASDASFEPPPRQHDDMVRLTSIHQSKGLEYPVVILADLGKRFNLADLSQRLILDEELGVCPRVRPPGRQRHYPSLAYWFARRRQQEEVLAEELRLLYVACTRAKDFLILSGTTHRAAWESRWPSLAASRFHRSEMLEAQCMLDWIGAWLIHHSQNERVPSTQEGQSSLCSWRVADASESPPAPTQTRAQATSDPPPDPTRSQPPEPEHLSQVLTWCYPQKKATHYAGRLSVTGLRRRVLQSEDDSRSLFRGEGQAGSDPNIVEQALSASSPAPNSSNINSVGAHQRPPKREDWTVGSEANRAAAPATPRPLEATAIGLVYHRFLELADLDKLDSPVSIQAELRRFLAQGHLADVEAEVIDPTLIAAFWTSSLGCTIRSLDPRCLHRELPFTFRFDQETAASLPLPDEVRPPAGEFAVLQGVVDLAILLPGEIWILDYKTDRCLPVETPAHAETYAPQLRLYGAALEQIYGRPTTRLWLHFLLAGRTIEVPLKPH